MLSDKYMKFFHGNKNKRNSVYFLQSEMKGGIIMLVCCGRDKTNYE